MIKNPFINALLATLYISLVASIMFYSPKVEQTNPSVLIPIAVLSLFVLSAAIMGFLFLGTPLQMYFEGQHKKAIQFFFKTVGSFATITLLVFIALFLLSQGRLQ